MISFKLLVCCRLEPMARVSLPAAGDGTVRVWDADTGNQLPDLS